VQKVTGIGGVFFRADAPEALSRWYEQHLGIDPAPPSYDVSSWWQQSGPTVFTAMESTSGHFGRPAQQWAVNFRVADLDAMVAQLRGAGIDVTVDGEVYPNGRFADLHDPEGNPIQLWEPAGADARGPDNP
jgi:predicted enzyme related to lactoylglutathione lyase